jgi:hypothetical protein
VTNVSELTLILLTWNVAQMVFFVWQFQKLVNKLMSRDFYDYQRGIKYEFPPSSSPAGKEHKLRLEEVELEAPPKDLGF